MKNRRRKKIIFPTIGVAGGVSMLPISATTTGAGQTVTLQRITPTGCTATVNWGDGSVSTIADGNTGTTTHVYAAAGSYTISIAPPSKLTYIDLRDTKLSFDSTYLTRCIALASLRIDIGGKFNSANIAGLPITSLHLSFPVAGTYTFNSANISAMALTSLTLSLIVVGTYTFNSSNISTMALTSLYLYLNDAGTYTFDSAHIAGMSTITTITIVLHTTNTFTVAQADWDGFPACGTIRVEAALTQTEVDNLLLGLWTGFPSKSVSGGTIDLLGQSNAAPSGVLQAHCPPTTGYEAAYELVNDSCDVSTKHYTSATTA